MSTACTRRLSSAALLASCLASAACVSTNIESVVNPSAAVTSVSSVMVWFPAEDLSLRRAAESTLAGEDSPFVAGHEIFFPGQTVDAETMLQELQQRGIEGVLLLSVRDAGANTGTTPIVAQDLCTTSSASGCVESTRIVTGGQTVVHPNAVFSAIVYDTTAGDPIWAATINTQGYAQHDGPDLVAAAMKKIRGRLAEDRVVR